MDPSDEDEVTVETVDDGYSVEPDQPAEGASNGIFTDLFRVLLQVNPWLWVVLAAGLYYLYQKNRHTVGNAYTQWAEKRAQEKETAEIKKNPDLYRSRMEAMERARRAMQERYSQDSQVAAVKSQEREEKKRSEDLENLESMRRGEGYRNKSRFDEATGQDKSATSSPAKDKKKANFRPDYNPLMGDGGACGYRPGRRNFGGRGGG